MLHTVIEDGKISLCPVHNGIARFSDLVLLCVLDRHVLDMDSLFGVQECTIGHKILTRFLAWEEQIQRSSTLKVVGSSGFRDLNERFQCAGHVCKQVSWK